MNRTYPAFPHLRSSQVRVAQPWGRLVLLLALLSSARAGVLDDWERALADLREPVRARRAPVEDLVLSFELGTLGWERGHCRVLPLLVNGDSLFVVELTGRGRLDPALPGELETLAARAALGRHAEDKRLRQVTWLCAQLPPQLARLDWRPLKPRLPFLARPGFNVQRALGRLSPDHPLLQSPIGTEPGWLLAEPDGLLWERQGDAARWLRSLHSGSSLHVPVSGVLRSLGDSLTPPRDPAWLPPTLATPALAVDSLVLELDRRGGRLHWTLELAGPPRTEPLWLLLDPAARLTAAEWSLPDGTRRPAAHNRRAGSANPGPWLLVEALPGSTILRLQGDSPAALVTAEAPGSRHAVRGNWFPRLPWWEAARPARLLDPGQLLPVWPDSLEQPGLTRLDALAPQRLLPETRALLPLGGGAALCWMPLRQRAAFQVPQPARVRRQTAGIENLDLPREREVRTPSHEEPAEPVDLSQGQDTLSLGILGEEQVLTELADAAARLEAWLGPAPEPVLLLERTGNPADRREEEDQLLGHDLAPDEPLEIGARELREATADARLARLETLCRGWWRPGPAEAAAAPRWIRHGAARACALLLLEERQGAPRAHRLRQAALNRQLSLFRPNAFASLPALGERAEGDWHSAETQDLLAWRFALLLEHLRWRLRNPQSLEDSAYRLCLRELALRLREPLSPREPLQEVKRALADFLVANDLLESSGFGDARALWAWLDAQWRESVVPELRVRTGRVETAEGPRLALRVDWSAPPAPSTVLPVLTRTTQGFTAYSLRATAQEEQFVLPLDPAELTGLEVAPGASLLARINLD